MSNTYQKDYNISREKELAFEQHLKIKYKCLTQNTDPDKYFPYWDVSTTATTGNNKITTFEVKFCGTEKIYIEDGKFNDEKVKQSTGLSLTTATYYTFTFKNDDSFYIIPTKELKELCIVTNPNFSARIDNNNFLLYVFSKEYLMNYLKKI